MSRKVSLTINHLPVQVPKGTTILEAARTLGIRIPQLCGRAVVWLAGGKICQRTPRSFPNEVAPCVENRRKASARARI